MNRSTLQAIVAILIGIGATVLYLFKSGDHPVEPQSVFTLYGAILGYVFGIGSEEAATSRAIRKQRENGPSSE